MTSTLEHALLRLGHRHHASPHEGFADTLSRSLHAIRTHLKLNRPIYARTAAYGHFGRAPEKDGGFSWEKTDLVEDLKAALG